MTCYILQVPEEHGDNVFGWSKMFYEMTDSYKWADSYKPSKMECSCFVSCL